MPTASAHSKASRSGPLRVGLSQRDEDRWLTVVGCLGLLLAAALFVFGLPPVDLHTPLHRMGIMDPMCGGTRSAWFTVHGQMGEAWRYNPLGIVAVLAAFLATARAIVGLIVGRWVSLRWRPGVRAQYVMAAGLLATVVLLEIRQQSRADLLMATLS